MEQTIIVPESTEPKVENVSPIEGGETPAQPAKSVLFAHSPEVLKNFITMKQREVEYATGRVLAFEKLVARDGPSYNPEFTSARKHLEQASDELQALKTQLAEHVPRKQVTAPRTKPPGKSWVEVVAPKAKSQEFYLEPTEPIPTVSPPPERVEELKAMNKALGKKSSPTDPPVPPPKREKPKTANTLGHPLNITVPLPTVNHPHVKTTPDPYPDNPELFKGIELGTSVPVEIGEVIVPWEERIPFKVPTGTTLYHASNNRLYYQMPNRRKLIETPWLVNLADQTVEFDPLKARMRQYKYPTLGNKCLDACAKFGPAKAPSTLLKVTRPTASSPDDMKVDPKLVTQKIPDRKHEPVASSTASVKAFVERLRTSAPDDKDIEDLVTTLKEVMKFDKKKAEKRDREEKPKDAKRGKKEKDTPKKDKDPKKGKTERVKKEPKIFGTDASRPKDIKPVDKDSGESAVTIESPPSAAVGETKPAPKVTKDVEMTEVTFDEPEPEAYDPVNKSSFPDANFTKRGLGYYENPHFKKTRDRLARNVNEVFYFPYHIVSEASLHKCREIAERFAHGRDMVFPVTGSPHPHPIGAYERCMMEDEAFKIISSLSPGEMRSVMAVDCSPRRLPRYTMKYDNLDILSVNPQLEPKDSQRISSFGTLPGWCRHGPLDCDCNTFTDILMVHSVYYYTPTQLIDMMTRQGITTFYAILHEFKNYKGSLCGGELEYIRKGRHIIASASGSRHPYMHGDSAWLFNNGWSDGVNHLVWDSISALGDTYLYQFNITDIPPRALPEEGLALNQVVLDEYHSGKIDVRGKVDPTHPPMVEDFKVEGHWIKQIWSVGPVIAVTYKSEEYSIPKKALYSAVEPIANNPRTPDLYQQCARHVKAQLLKYNIPPQDRAVLIPICTALAFNMTVHQETSMLWTFVKPMLRTYARLNAAYKFEFVWNPWNDYKWWALAASIVGSIGLLALYRSQRKNTSPQLKALLDHYWSIRHKAGPATGSIFNFDKVVAFFKQQFGRFYSWYHIVNMGLGTIVTDVCVNGVAFPEKQEKARIETSEEKMCKPKPGAQLIGFQVRHVQPVMPRTCVHNEEAALRIRITSPDTAQEKSWRKLRKVHAAHKHEFLKPPKEGVIEPTPDAEWLARFPENRRNTLAKGLDAVHKFGLERKDSFIKAFVKREFYLNNWQFKPRLIQGREPKFQAATGAWTHAFTNFLKEQWHSKRWKKQSHSMYYTCGAYAEDMGEWIADMHLLFLALLVLFDIDCSNFDGSVGLFALLFTHAIYMPWVPDTPSGRCFVHSMAMQFGAQVGKTPGGVFFLYWGKRKSGDGDTSCGNTLINAVMVWAFFMRLKEIVKQAHQMFMGDDNVVASSTYVLPYIKDLERWITNLGFKPKINIRPTVATLEYCSGYFYQINDAPSKLAFCWGPKVGKAGLKLGWNKNTPFDDPFNAARHLRGVAMGLDQQTNHVPILRAIIKRYLQLTNAVLATPKYEHHQIRARKSHPATPEIMDQFYELYGLTVEDIKAMEEEVSTANFGQKLSHPGWDWIIERDSPLKPYRQDYVIEHTGPQPGALLATPGWLLKTNAMFKAVTTNLKDRVRSWTDSIKLGNDTAMIWVSKAAWWPFKQIARLVDYVMFYPLVIASVAILTPLYLVRMALPNIPYTGCGWAVDKWIYLLNEFPYKALANYGICCIYAAPLLEEPLKRVKIGDHAVGFWAIVIAEYCKTLSRVWETPGFSCGNKLLAAAVIYAPVFAMHWIAASLSLKKGMLVHSVYNTFIWNVHAKNATPEAIEAPILGA